MLKQVDGCDVEEVENLIYVIFTLPEFLEVHALHEFILWYSQNVDWVGDNDSIMSEFKIFLGGGDEA